MLRILVIDDNPHDRILAIRSLEREFSNLQIKEILTAEDLSQVLKIGDFDLVITDYLLRWSDGLAVLRSIKAHYPDCPIIMFTNSGTQEIAVEAMKSGLDDYVIKSPKHYIRLAAAVRLAWERVQIQRKAMGLENRLQGLLNQLNVGIFRLTLDGSLLEGNPAFFRLLGLSKLSLSQAGQSLKPYFKPEDYAQLLNQLKENGQIRDREVELRRADGKVIWVRLNETLNSIEGQTIIEGLMEDASDRKQAEQALKESESRFRRLVQSNLIGCIFWDTSGKIIDANDAFLQMVGYTREDLQAGKLHWKNMTPVEQLPWSEQSIDQIKQYGAAHPLEKEYIRSDGTRVPVLLGGVLLEGSDDKGVSFVLDLSQQKQLEHQLRQQADQLEEANRLKDEFLAILSHELRSPLNAILGWTQMLRTRRLDEVATMRALETIERNAKLQTQLVEDLLDISRIIRGKLTLKVSLVNLASIIDATFEAMRLATQAKSIQIQSWIDPTVGLVSGDPNRLQQVIWNLLSNAVKFTPPGGRVTIVVERQGTQAQIRVSDTGKGISPEFLPHVFDYFRQADSSTTRAHGGLGLGLAIVHHLVELHGGTVSASSPGVGQGATFIVNLPLTLDPTLQDSQQNFHTTESVPFSDTVPILNGKRVLVVDDEADTRDFYTTVLKDCGASVTAVASAKDALNAIAQQRPDLLVSDISMPCEDGYALIRQVRALESEQGEHLPAIALTAYAREIDRQQAIAAGFQRHLSKPVEPTDLVAMVAHLVRQTEPGDQ